MRCKVGPRLERDKSMLRCALLCCTVLRLQHLGWASENLGQCMIPGVCALF